VSIAVVLAEHSGAVGGGTSGTSGTRGTRAATREAVAELELEDAASPFTRPAWSPTASSLASDAAASTAEEGDASAGGVPLPEGEVAGAFFIGFATIATSFGAASILLWLLCVCNYFDE
jgi:hypothetical protein